MSRRFQRNPRRIRFAERDAKILQALFEARYLTNRLVERLFFAPTTASWCRQRMRCLFDAGFVRKRQAYPNEPDVYYLGLKGRRYIAHLHSYPQPLVDKIAGVGGNVPAPMLMMHHELALSELYVSTALECRQHGYRLQWKNTRMLELEGLGIQPDAYLRVEGPSRSQTAYLEYTAVMPTRSELAGKLDRYQACFKARGPVMVLWLANSAKKLEHLQAAVREHPCEDWFLFGLIQEARQPLTGAIWRHAEGDELVRLVAPRTHLIYSANGPDRAQLSGSLWPKGGGPIPNDRA